MEPAATRAFYLGRYNCMERVGEGALGETFRAKIYGVAGFEKQFAVQRLHARLCVDEAFVARFVAAATAYAGLDHERIARVHEVNVQGAQYYLVNDLVRGLDLARLLDTLRPRGEAVTSDAAMLLALDLCEALEHAHARKDLLPGGVLHLGLSPQAVMLTSEGEVKLLDVGLLASLIRPGWADDDGLVPTLAYLAPEALRGGPVDARADVFSLGAILHELLSGARAFDGATAAELRRQIDASPPAPPAADGRLQALLGKSMAVDVEARFPSVAALREALVPILGSRATRARSELGAVVRRLIRPPSRTGSFAAVVMPPAPIAAPPVAAAAPWSPPPSRPPPIPPQAADGPRRPRGPQLTSPPPMNTFSGVGADDGVLAQLDLIELPGPTTTPSMPAVSDDAETVPIARVDPEPLPPVKDPPPVRERPVSVSDLAVEPGGASVEPGGASMEAPPAGPDESAPLAAFAAALSPGTLTTPERGEPLRMLVPEEPADPPLGGDGARPVEPSKGRAFVPPPLAAAAPPRAPRWVTIGLTVVGLASVALVIAHFTGRRDEAPAPPIPSTNATAQAHDPATAPTAATTAPAEKTTPPSTDKAATTAKTTTAKMPTENPTTAKTTPQLNPATVTTAEKTRATAIETTPPRATTPASATRAPTSPGSPASTVPGTATPISPTAGTGLDVATTPPGALVFVDGEARGASPLHVELAAGPHQLIVLGEGFKLHRESVRVRGAEHLELTLEPARLPAEVTGPAGLKVRCHSSLRILVDGADSGRMCPNDERISVTPGPHKIGLYSPLTEETHELDADVKDGDRSTRVYTKY